jgi:hypothetical protein
MDDIERGESFGKAGRIADVDEENRDLLLLANRPMKGGLLGLVSEFHVSGVQDQPAQPHIAGNCGLAGEPHTVLKVQSLSQCLFFGVAWGTTLQTFQNDYATGRTAGITAAFIGVWNTGSQGCC